MSTMNLKSLAPIRMRRAIGKSIRNFTRKPSESFGSDFIGEVKSRLSKINVHTIFDVGANIGITALEFSDSFPDSTIYAFEPSTFNFGKMQSNLIGKPEIKRFKIAFGASKSTSTLFLDPQHPTMARLVAADNCERETVEIDTIDNFCETMGISKIDILKIDTEGHELPVLQGAYHMMKRDSVSIVKAEVAADPDHDYHTPFLELSEILHVAKFRLFGFYDQCENTLYPGPRLRRFDAVFIHQQLC